MVVLLVDNGVTGISDDYFKEVATIYDKYANVDYIHINIPTGADAIRKYENTIADVPTIDVKKYALDDANSKTNFDEVFNSLVATLHYYQGISKVYDKTDFVISDMVELESLNQDNDAVFGIYISSKEKYLLNKAIDLLTAKIGEMDKYQTDYFDLDRYVGGLNGGC